MLSAAFEYEGSETDGSGEEEDDDEDDEEENDDEDKVEDAGFEGEVIKGAPGTKEVDGSGMPKISNVFRT